MQTANRFPGQYNLIKLNLINYKGYAIDIRQVFIDLDIQYDVFNTTTHGILRFRDKGDFQQNFPLIGEERIEVVFSVDAQSPELKFTFYVYQQADKNQNGENEFYYSLPFVSEDFIRNEDSIVRQSFHNTNVAEIVSTALKKISSKPLKVDEVINSISFIPPSIKPFEVINYCLPRCISKQYPKSAGYMFYEDSFGYNLRCIDSLFKTTPIKYTFEKKNYTSNDFNNEFYSVTNYQIIQQYNVLDNLVKGYYGSSIYSLNPYTREYTKNSYDYFNDYTMLQHLESNNVDLKIHSNKFQFKNSINSNIKLLTEYDYQTKAKQVPIRLSQLNQISNGLKMIIEVPGNTELNVGKTLELIYPNHTNIEEQKHDIYLKGLYFITGLRHILKPNEFSTSLEIIKDSFKNSIESHDRTGLIV